MPDHEVEAIAECLLPPIRAFYESEEGRREFAEWKKKQAEKAAREDAATPKPKG